jgi:hypothetical protein
MRGVVVFHIIWPYVGFLSWLHGNLPCFINHHRIIQEESFLPLPKKLFAVSLRGSKIHWLL